MLELHNITKFFLQNTEPTLKSINLKVGEGEYCVILGSNGSGKSTFSQHLNEKLDCLCKDNYG